MNLTTGELLFFGGLAGALIVLMISGAVIAVLSGSRKRLRKKLDEEYGAPMV